MKYRVLFFGSASFSIPLLEGLARDTRFDVIGVVTQPDRPAGRKGTLTPPPIKTAGLNLGIKIYQYESVKLPEVIEELKTLAPDLLIVASFGQIMPQVLLDAAPRGAINFHWSLLPKYRGASPIQAALINGEEKTGATIMLMDAKMDHGAILAQFEEPISSDDTSDTLYHKLGTLGAPLLADTVIKYVEGTITPTEQDHSQATFVKLLSRDDGKLDPASYTATELERRVRAYQPWPGTFLELQGKRLKILNASVGKMTNMTSGSTIEQDHLPAVICKDGSALLLQEVQPEGKTPMSGGSFLQGQRSVFVKA